MKYLDEIEKDYDYRRDSCVSCWRDNSSCLSCVYYDGNISIEELMRIKTERVSYFRGNKGNKKKKNV